jgi:hypothetical protein
VLAIVLRSGSSWPQVQQGRRRTIISYGLRLSPTHGTEALVSGGPG